MIVIRIDKRIEDFEQIKKLALEGHDEAECLIVTGDDLEAAKLAAERNAECLHIWTSGDMFMTADPHVIRTSYVIRNLSFNEAFELSNYGANVINPSNMYPVYTKNIPVMIHNANNPEETTLIEKHCSDNRVVKGVQSINETSLITVAGLTMVGVIGVNKRIFTALADNDISVFFVGQGSSENNTSIGVKNEDAVKACGVLTREFEAEIREGSMYPVKLTQGLSTIAVVGENMRTSIGTAGKLFGALGRSGVNVIAVAQGSGQTNISIVISHDYLRKALNVIHDSFFLSQYQERNLFICGVGTVGKSLIQQILSQREKLKEERHLKLNIVGVASSKKAVLRREGIEDPLGEISNAPEDSSTEKLRDMVIGMNIFNAVFVDCTASDEVAKIYKDLLKNSVSVVAANKVATSSSYEKYAELKAIALDRGVKYLYETNVGAGLPVISTINDLMNSGDKILKIEAVLSGTLNFIFNTLSSSVPFSETIRMAKEEGFSEPDPRIDMSGKDVMRKLVILSRESGYSLNLEDVKSESFVPASLFEGSLDDFWKAVPALDADFEARRKVLEAEHKRWRFVAKLEDGKGSVSLKEVDEHHPFYDLEGSNNIIMLTTERYHDHPMLIKGYGAGADVTAAGVFADILRI